jgi:hypothetical protein
MSANNPEITASNIIDDVENRLGNPNIGADIMLPWVSYAYQKTYQALINVNQQVKETYFGALAEFDLTPGVAEYSINENIPRFGGFIKVEIRYGASGDQYVRASKLPSVANWYNQSNDSTSYTGKNAAMYYLIGDNLGFIPTPPAGEVSQDVVARVWYVKRPYQITEEDDIIDIPYRFLYPIANYVQARAIQRENEDYEQAALVERKFETELEQIAEAADSEYSESEGGNYVQVASDSPLYQNPMRS